MIFAVSLYSQAYKPKPIPTARKQKQDQSGTVSLEEMRRGYDNVAARRHPFEVLGLEDKKEVGMSNNGILL